MKKKLREAAAELPASASRISFLYIGRPYVGGFFHLHQPEVCWNWTMAQWDMFCKDCVEVLDATHFKWEPVKAKDGRPVIDRKTGQPKVKVSGRHTQLANSQYVATVHFDTGKPHVHILASLR